MTTYEVISTKRTKKGKLMASLFKDVNSLVVNAFIKGDETEIEIGKPVSGEIIFGDKFAVFVVF